MVETNTKIDLITLVPFTVASYKHISKVPEEPMPTARQKMLDWAEGNKLTLSEDQQLLGFNDFMGGGKNGYTFCVPVPIGVEGSGDIVITTFEGGLYATLRPHPTADRIWETFGPLYRSWLEESDYQDEGDGDRQCFEVHVPQTRNLSDLARLSPDKRWMLGNVLQPVGKKQA